LRLLSSIDSFKYEFVVEDHGGSEKRSLTRPSFKKPFARRMQVRIEGEAVKTSGGTRVMEEERGVLTLRREFGRRTHRAGCGLQSSSGYALIVPITRDDRSCALVRRVQSIPLVPRKFTEIS
jgi:hypothetical protein